MSTYIRIIEEGKEHKPIVGPDDREPKSCPRCGEMCVYDGWGHVHRSGLGIGSCRPEGHLQIGVAKMKLVTWIEENVPDDLEMTEDGCAYMFEDHPWGGFNLELGDQIQFLSGQGNGTRCFFVIDVCPLVEDEPGQYTQRKLVTIEE
ncbi:MAG: hypothetical protein ACJ74Y_13955 [Bryobacteraceae bacterium]|jgi:hypothetical protein